MSDANILRLLIFIAFVVLCTVIVITGRRRDEQGRRKAQEDSRILRREPILGNEGIGFRSPEFAEQKSSPEHTEPKQAPLALGESTLPGARADDRFDRIVMIYLAARAGAYLNGADLLVAAEKAGLTYGHMGIFHRLYENQSNQPPIFSVANLVKPGSFDMLRIKEMRTPGISFFAALPAPVSALDAWDAMLPTAQRMAELLDGVLLDEDRNALSRQRIAHIREELRLYDRARETSANRW